MNIKDVENNKYYKVKYKNKLAIFYNKIVDNVVIEVYYIHSQTVIIDRNLKIAYPTINAWIQQASPLIESLEEISEEQLKADMVLELL